MNIKENVSLQAYSTMRLGGVAKYLCEVNEHGEIPQLVEWALQKQLPLVMIGEGSNIVWRDEGFPGLVLVNKIAGYEVQKLDDETTYVVVGSGEKWDSVVGRTVDEGLAGIELLSSIPGTAGAAPVQNIGAYGSQLSETLVTVEAYDIGNNNFINLRASECNFGYRTSRFKTTGKGNFLITGITLQLHKYVAHPPYYKDIQAYIEKHAITEVSLATLREIVTKIREVKLPDPSVVANTGSFFRNPIISQYDFTELAYVHPEINQAPVGWTQPPRWILDDGRVKLSAGWLMDQCGFKAIHDTETGIATWDTQTLVLVNEHAESTTDLLKFKQKIVDAVQARFGITLEQEPELLP